MRGLIKSARESNGNVIVDLDEFIALAVELGVEHDKLLKMKEDIKIKDDKRHQENVAWDNWRDSLLK